MKAAEFFSAVAHGRLSKLQWRAAYMHILAVLSGRHGLQRREGKEGRGRMEPEGRYIGGVREQLEAGMGAGCELVYTTKIYNEN